MPRPHRIRNRWIVTNHSRIVSIQMKRTLNMPLAGFALAVVAMAVLIGWTWYTTWQQVSHLRKHYGTLESESFRFADHLEAGIRSLNDTLLRYDLHDEPKDYNLFRSESRDLREWIVASRSHLTSEAERELFEEIAVQYEPYLSNATRLLVEAEQAHGERFSERLFDRVEAGSGRLLELSERLDEAHRAALGELVANSHGVMVRLQWLLWFSLFLLIALSASVAVLVYRGMIAPLRSQLIESRAELGRQEKLSSLGVLAAGVAHEIRNPLTALKVRLHGLRKALQGDPRLQDVEVIDNEISRLERIVRDFLHFARPSDPELEAVPVTDLFQQIYELFDSQLRKHSIRLDLDAPTGVSVRADREQIKQVLINLARNAAESIEDGGTITLRAIPRAAPLGGRDLPAVALEISDNGKGMPPDVQRRLFDPFFTTKEQGTGLGLSIAARIIHRHGGSIHCQTQVDRGTTFTLLLPRAEPDES